MKDLAERINAEHGKAERALRSGVEHAARAGELLLKAKEKIGHGGWLGWLKDNVAFSERLAQAYMQLASLPVEKRNAVADLPLRKALSAIGHERPCRHLPENGPTHNDLMAAGPWRHAKHSPRDRDDRLPAIVGARS
jgi:DUF3102 family protein